MSAKGNVTIPRPVVKQIFLDVVWEERRRELRSMKAVLDKWSEAKDKPDFLYRIEEDYKFMRRELKNYVFSVKEVAGAFQDLGLSAETGIGFKGVLEELEKEHRVSVRKLEYDSFLRFPNGSFIYWDSDYKVFNTAILQRFSAGWKKVYCLTGNDYELE